MTRSERTLAAVAGASLVAAVIAVLVFTRPEPAPVVVPGTHIEHLPGELPAVRDDIGHYAPGSPSAVSEAFLRLWWRAHYEDARALATGEMRARCERNLRESLALPPDERETLRETQVIAEAAAFDLERATVTDLPAGDGGTPRKQLRGVIHVHGLTPDHHPVENRREQVLTLEMVDGGWKVSAWTPATTTDGGMQVR